VSEQTFFVTVREMVVALVIVLVVAPFRIH